jgi:hypothetical protein
MARTITRPIAGLGHSTLDPAGPMTPPLPPTIKRMTVADAPQTARTLEAPGTVQRPEHRPFAIVAQRLVAAGQRPQVRVEVIGINGVLVTLTVAGMPGPIARARTRRRAREIARTTVAAVLGLDPYAFDLEVHGA